MEKNSFLRDFEKGKIEAFRQEGKTIKEIAARIKRSKTAINNFWNKRKIYFKKTQ